MSAFLNEMTRGSRERCAAERAREPVAALGARARSARPVRPLVLAGFDLIAEVKPASPSQGALMGSGADVMSRCVAQAEAYVRAGAAVVSVLTEPTRFGGSNDLLRMVAGAAERPVMRKDFLVDPYQVVQARADGASGVLLIIRMLSDAQMGEMLGAAAEHGLFALLEAFDESDLERTRGLRPGAGAASVMLGLNTRNLADLSVDAGRLERLAGRFPTGFVRVAESGLESPADAARVAGLGYHLALVGTALMRSGKPGELARAMIEQGRAAAAQRTPDRSSSRFGTQR